MLNYYPQILGIIDIINKWNEKLNDLSNKYMGNVGVGTGLFLLLLGIGFFAVNTFNKKK